MCESYSDETFNTNLEIKIGLDEELVSYRNFELAKAFMEQIEHCKKAHKGST